MARGFLSGALAGVVVAGVGTGAISVVLGPVFAPKPEVTDATRVEPAAPEAPGQESPPKGVVRETTSPQSPSPGIPVPESQAGNAQGIADTQSTGLPETGAAEELTTAPEAAQAANLRASAENPVLPNPQGNAPDAPAGDELSISNNPVQPPAPKPAVDETAPQMAGAPDTGGAFERPEGEAPVAAQDTPVTVADATGSQETAPRPIIIDETAPRPEPESKPEPVPEPVPVPEAAPEPAPEVEPAAEPESEAPPETAPKPRVTALLEREEETPSTRPQVGQPAGTFENRAQEVKTGRLPSLTDSAGAQEPKRPIEQFSEPVDVEGNKPMMAVVLIDDGSTPLGLEALESFPYPITFAVDTAWSGATEAMKTYREAGFEVMALANMPAGALPQDAEVTLSTALAKVPEAVAVLEGDAGGLQESRPVSDQVASILAQSGHGLVMYPKGLNTAQTLAKRAGVPAVTLFRDFDSKGQNARVIRRFLDQAAFKAGQEGAVIMLGRLRAETISALLIWGLQDRAERVALVPVTKVLLAKD